ncbi:MAG: hypothetical protein JWM31_33 [Solirubrobacterales bacterium]|nr:hypothetical protein [Solirubrobacterales bacterium]
MSGAHFVDWSVRMLDELDAQDRADERGDVCPRCRKHHHAGACIGFFPPQLRAVTGDQPECAGRLLRPAFPRNSDSARDYGPSAA